MRPFNRPSKWVKIRPWYYTERRLRSRDAVKRDVIEQDIEDCGGVRLDSRLVMAVAPYYTERSTARFLRRYE